jgi:ABC-type molybdenum transport system ATPase subunit/photorepair protein PhrA
MTVRETLMFAAECRMPRNSTKEERMQRVDEVIAGLKLTNAQNTPVGDELIRGVSSGEKKRTEVATEMIARPRMLFLDEPTSWVSFDFLPRPSHTNAFLHSSFSSSRFPQTAASTTSVLASPWSSFCNTSSPKTSASSLSSTSRARPCSSCLTTP